MTISKNKKRDGIGSWILPIFLMLLCVGVVAWVFYSYVQTLNTKILAGTDKLTECESDRDSAMVDLTKCVNAASDKEKADLEADQNRRATDAFKAGEAVGLIASTISANAQHFPTNKLSKSGIEDGRFTIGVSIDLPQSALGYRPSFVVPSQPEELKEALEGLSLILPVDAIGDFSERMGTRYKTTLIVRGFANTVALTDESNISNYGQCSDSKAFDCRVEGNSTRIDIGEIVYDNATLACLRARCLISTYATRRLTSKGVNVVFESVSTGQPDPVKSAEIFLAVSIGGGTRQEFDDFRYGLESAGYSTH